MIITGWDIRGAKIVTKSTVTFDYIVVAGGGAGGERGGGGGGGGGVVAGQLSVREGTIGFEVGGGGTQSTPSYPGNGAPGSNSRIVTPLVAFGSIDAIGGGGGGGGETTNNYENRTLEPGLPGGSGGGGRGGGFNQIPPTASPPGPLRKREYSEWTRSRQGF